MMTKASNTKTFHSKFTNQGKLNQITNIVAADLDPLYDFFGVKKSMGSKVCFSSCFIHGGDNDQALNLYYNADYRIHYKCRTHNCHKYFGTSLLSMVRGGLSHVKYSWTKPGDKTVHFDDTVEFLLDKYAIDYEDTIESKIDYTHQEFCNLSKSLMREKPTKGYPKDLYRQSVEIPSQYYLKRGYSIEILDDFDVGVCKSYGKQMYNRSVVPIYNEDGDRIIGCSGRSLFEECSDCHSYHDPKKKCHNFPKWRHSRGVNTENILYNYHKALPSVQETGVIIVVESPGNVWKLAEMGINNAVALLGTSLSDNQKRLIDESGAFSIILIMDNDDNNAGQDAAIKIKDQCQLTHRVYIVNIDKNDISDMNDDEITEDIVPWIKAAGEI